MMIATTGTCNRSMCGAGRASSRPTKCHQRSLRCHRMVALSMPEDSIEASTSGRLFGTAMAAVAAVSVWMGGSLHPAQAVDIDSRQPAHVEHAQPLADVAGLFGSDERDPIEPFTLYGTNFKKFVIEKLQGEKIVSRSRGFTVNTCVGSAVASQEVPSFQRLSTGEKVEATGNSVCDQATGSDLKQTCSSSCESACGLALAKWEEQEKERSGFVLLEKDRTRLLRTCSRECAIDCTRPGKAYDFVIPYRK